MSRLFRILVPFASSFITAAAAHAQHTGDIHLAVEDGQLVTGRVNPDQSIDLGIRVFGATFGDSGFPEFTSNPGFDAPPGTFPTGTSIGFNALAGWTAWNGDGFEPADGESLRIAFSSLFVIVEDEPIEGFTLGVQSNGGWHRHLNYFILGPNDDAEDPLPGIYLLEMELYSTSASIDPSEPFWKVFNYNMPDSVHLEAIQWVEDNLAGATCQGDFTDDGMVNGADLLVLLGQWGECSGECPADMNGDTVVNGADLLVLLSAWGPCP